MRIGYVCEKDKWIVKLYIDDLSYEQEQLFLKEKAPAIFDELRELNESNQVIDSWLKQNNIDLKEK
jgi:hypothetical protein